MRIKVILNTLESGELSIGGKTSRGLGSFKIEIDTNEKQTADDIKKLLNCN